MMDGYCYFVRTTYSVANVTNGEVYDTPYSSSNLVQYIVHFVWYASTPQPDIQCKSEERFQADTYLTWIYNVKNNEAILDFISTKDERLMRSLCLGLRKVWILI